MDRDLVAHLGEGEPVAVDAPDPGVVAQAASDPFARVPDELRGLMNG